MKNIIVKTSRYAFAETVARLTEAVTRAGSTVFATIDQRAAAASVGLALRPTTLIVFGNPKGGTPLMDAVPLVALDLPLKLLVWEESGVVDVAYTPASVIADWRGVTGFETLVASMDKALETITSSIA